MHLIPLKKMITLAKLAFRNIAAAGLRTILNVVVLSICFVVIIWTQSLYKGMFDHSRQLSIDYDIAAGQYWSSNYEPYDPFSIDTAHAKIPTVLINDILLKKSEPILIKQATIYPEGRMQSVLMKGINPNQTITHLPTYLLDQSDHPLPILIGKRMAKQAKLDKNDRVMIRWSDANGGFDAAEALVVDVMQVDVPNIDSGQIWLGYDKLSKMVGLNMHATIITLGNSYSKDESISNWTYKSQTELLSDFNAWKAQENTSASILYIILMLLAIIGIFDSQIFALFKRRKEIGTLMALGMARSKIILLFLLESLYIALFASLLALLYGLPICYYTAANGINFGKQMDNYSLAIGHIVYPVFTLDVILLTGIILWLIVLLVSYLPLRKINKLNPTDALRGKWS